MSIRPFRDIKRRETREINVGKVKVGGANPISVQSMTNTLTTDVKATINQINEIFTPSEEEISKAKRIMDQFKKANTGLVVIDGKLIERPVLREMQRKLLVANKINKS